MPDHGLACKGREGGSSLSTMVGWEEWKKNDKYGEKKISNRSRGKDGERAQEKIGMADMKRKYEI